jgi:RNA polymerase sigma-70 factor (ECF subfamily)
MALFPLRRNPPAAALPRSGSSVPAPGGLDFEAVYEENLSFVWKAARRLGIETADTDDVVQEVFLVAYRKLAEFEGRASIKTWLLKILMFVVRHHRRTRQRKPGLCSADSHQDLQGLHDSQVHGPAEVAERAEAVRVLDGLLGQLDREKREVFVLAEIEQLSSVEIAEILDENVNTIYSRLRVARQEFQEALALFHTSELGRQP